MSQYRREGEALPTGLKNSAQAHPHFRLDVAAACRRLGFDTRDVRVFIATASCPGCIDLATQVCTEGPWFSVSLPYDQPLTVEHAATALTLRYLQLRTDRAADVTIREGRAT